MKCCSWYLSFACMQFFQTRKRICWSDRLLRHVQLRFSWVQVQRFLRTFLTNSISSHRRTHKWSSDAHFFSWLPSVPPSNLSRNRWRRFKCSESPWLGIQTWRKQRDPRIIGVALSWQSAVHHSYSTSCTKSSSDPLDNAFHRSTFTCFLSLPLYCTPFIEDATYCFCRRPYIEWTWNLLRSLSCCICK